jgi:AraC family L-rhamnose operon regulatory protein RhaS
VDGRSWPLRQGDLTITRPWQFHRVGDPHIGPSRLIWLILDVGVRRPNQPWQWPDWLVCDPADLDTLTTLLRFNERPRWPAGPQIARCFRRLDELLAEEAPHALPAKLALRTNELLLAVLEMLQGQHISLDAHLATSQRTVAMFLAELPRYAARPWTLASMAAQCGLSRSQFASYCKQITNMTPITYLNSCRVREAAALLRERPALPITEVAFASGFNSSQYFATVFKAHFGRTPQRYRQIEEPA